MCNVCVGRRSLLLGGAAAVATLPACDRIDLVSDEEVERMGLAAWEEMTREMPRSSNALRRETLDTISRRILTAGGERPGDWEVVLFAREDANAFALPGRKIGVFEGMFEVAGSDDQLAAIVGHEIGHVAAEHSKERMEAQVAGSVGIRLLAWLLQAGDIEYAGEIAAALGVGVQYGLILPYSRRQELEADRLGLIAMAQADYDPREAVDLWRRMEAANDRRTPEFLATHPAPDSRIEAIEEMLPELI